MKTTFKSIIVDDEELAREDLKVLLKDFSEIEIIGESETVEETKALIKKLDLGEIETTRLKDSIKINKDLAEARRESTKAIDEATLKTAELQKEILLQEQALNGEIKNLDNERLQDQKENVWQCFL